MTINLIQLRKVLDFFSETQDIADKSKLEERFIERFEAQRLGKLIDLPDNSVTVRFSANNKSDNESCSNTILALGKIRPRDNHPILSVLVTKGKNYIKLINSSYLKKVSHSSQNLTLTNIRGSINYSDIIKEFEGIANSIENIEKLFLLHQEHEFSENLVRIVEATNQIVAQKEKYVPNGEQLRNLVTSGTRSIEFVKSSYFNDLESELTSRVERNAKAIMIAGTCIENVNIRGRVIETLVTSDNPTEISSIVNAVYAHNSNIKVTTEDGLADFVREYEKTVTGTDIKTKVMYLQSAPKAFSVDKILQFLSEEDTVFLFFLIGINDDESLYLKLVPLFDENLLKGLKIQTHWSGRNQRGHGQFSGQALYDILVQDKYKLEHLSENHVSDMIKEWIAL